jgi:hypothetical protein
LYHWFKQFVVGAAKNGREVFGKGKLLLDILLEWVWEMKNNLLTPDFSIRSEWTHGPPKSNWQRKVCSAKYG